jgi:enoyl-CoA hydratase/carnithine racemase
MPQNGANASLSCRVGDVLLRAADGVVDVTIDRPHVKNAINTAVIEGLETAVQLAYDQAARALVIRGSAGTFCAGADLRELEMLRQRPARLDEFMMSLGSVFDRLESAPFPVLAIVAGHAVAGGLELLLACDIVVAATTARIGDRHLEYGLVPAAGSSVRLSRRVPAAHANYLLLSGDLISGEQAAAWGLASCAAPLEDLEALAERILARLASRSCHAAATVKAMIANARGLTAPDALSRERALFLQHMASPDALEGLTAFAERRTPVFPPHSHTRKGENPP